MYERIKGRDYFFYLKTAYCRVCEFGKFYQALCAHIFSSWLEFIKGDDSLATQRKHTKITIFINFTKISIIYKIHDFFVSSESFHYSLRVLTCNPYSIQFTYVALVNISRHFTVNLIKSYRWVQSFIQGRPSRLQQLIDLQSSLFLKEYASFQRGLDIHWASNERVKVYLTFRTCYMHEFLPVTVKHIARIDIAIIWHTFCIWSAAENHSTFLGVLSDNKHVQSGAVCAILTLQEVINSALCPDFNVKPSKLGLPAWWVILYKAKCRPYIRANNCYNQAPPHTN